MGDFLDLRWTGIERYDQKTLKRQVSTGRLHDELLPGWIEHCHAVEREGDIERGLRTDWEGKSGVCGAISEDSKSKGTVSTVTQ